MGKNDSYYGGKKSSKKDTFGQIKDIENIDKKIYYATAEMWGDVNLKYASAEILRERPDLPGIRVDNLIKEDMDRVAMEKEDVVNVSEVEEAQEDEKIGIGEYFGNVGDIYLNDIKRFIKYSNGAKKRILMNIWLCLSKANAYSRKDLEEIEDSIFTIGGVVLPERERVRVEFIRINRYSRTGDFTKETLMGLKELYKTNYEDKKDIIKKEIVRIEAFLGMDIAFLNTSLEVAKEETRIISMEMEKVKKRIKSE